MTLSENTPLLRKQCVESQEREPLVAPDTDANVHEHLSRACKVPGAIPHSEEVVRQLKKQVSSEFTRSEKEQPATENELDRETARIVRVVYVLAVLTMVMRMTTDPMLLLYLQHSGFTTKDNVGFYVMAVVVESVVPVMGHVAVGALAARVGAQRALIASCALISLGLFGMSSSPPSKAAFVVSFAVYSLSQSIRVVRTVILTERVPAKLRTGVMSLHMLMTPVGALMGPLLWLACEQYRSDIPLFGRLRFNMYTLNYFVAASISVIMALVSAFALPATCNTADGNDDSSSSTNTGVGNGQVLHLQLSDGSTYDVNAKSYQRSVFLFFCVIMICVNIVMGLYMVNFQPLLVNRFNASGQELGVIFFIISLLALIPPLLVAYLSRFLQDRHIIVIGLLAKMIGIALFLPLFDHEVHEWQVICGFILIIKASIFFFTASMSLFTKLLGIMSNGTLLGILSSCSALGPAAAQLLFAERMLTVFGTFGYAAFGAPVVLAMVIVIHPWFWSRLDPDREFTRVLLREYNSINSQE